MKYSHGQVDRLGAPYDVTSLMHLPRSSWSRNGRNTIESRAGAHVVLGQRRGLSVVDKQQLNQLYRCGSNQGKKIQRLRAILLTVLDCKIHLNIQ